MSRSDTFAWQKTWQRPQNMASTDPKSTPKSWQQQHSGVPQCKSMKSGLRFATVAPLTMICTLRCSPDLSYGWDQERCADPKSVTSGREGRWFLHMNCLDVGVFNKCNAECQGLNHCDDWQPNVLKTMGFKEITWSLQKLTTTAKVKT